MCVCVFKFKGVYFPLLSVLFFYIPVALILSSILKIIDLLLDKAPDV